jgi:Fis family transcriptional regulator, factor for inversion stimulation protein
MMAKAGSKKKPQQKQKERRDQSIFHCVENALNNYFEDMDGHDPSDLYELVLSQTEKPMLQVVLKQTQGNITRSAEMLGINRATLRKKLKKYDLE